MKTTLEKETVFELLQVQIVQYLMVEKYGLRADRNFANPVHNEITREEFAEDLENLFGDNNSQMVDALYWVINDAVCGFNPIGWDEKVIKSTEEN